MKRAFFATILFSSQKTPLAFRATMAPSCLNSSSRSEKASAAGLASSIVFRPARQQSNEQGVLEEPEPLPCDLDKIGHLTAADRAMAKKAYAFGTGCHFIGHVGWAIQLSSGKYLAGEASPSMRRRVLFSSEESVFSYFRSRQLKAVKDKSLEKSDIDSALKVATDLKDTPWSFPHYTCVDESYEILSAYGWDLPSPAFTILADTFFHAISGEAYFLEEN